MPDHRANAVGFIGLGNIGAPMAAHLTDWPEGLVVCDLRAEAAAPLVAKGATLASSPAEVGAAAEVISVMVLDDDQVRSVVAELLTTAEPGTVIAIHSTIRPETAEELAVVAAEQGVHVVDAPVSGSVLGAHQGSLAVMVGGTDEAVARCREPFERWAGLFLHLGPVGSGTRAKLARNIVHFVAFTAVGEALRLAEAAGIDLQALGKVVRHTDAITGGAGSIILRDTTTPLEPGDDWYDTMLHVRSLGEKDLTLALALAADLDVDLPLSRLALDELARGIGVPHEDA